MMRFKKKRIRNIGTGSKINPLQKKDHYRILFSGVCSVPGDQLFGACPVGGAADPPPPRSAGPGS
jgi:hypothetical protein